MNNRCLCLSLFLCLFYGASLTAAEVFARFRVLEPAQGEVYLQLGGYIHKAPWYLPKGRFPEDKGTTFSAGKWSGWLNLTQWSQGRLHGRMNRSGGVAEFPNVTLDIQCSEDYSGRAIEVELATQPDPIHVKKRFREKFTGTHTSFLVSPNLEADADDLETASEMSARRLSWAKKATGNLRISPERHILQTSLWAPQRQELQVKELKVLSLLGFNVVGNRRDDVKGFPELRRPGHTHNISHGPGMSRTAIDANMAKVLARTNHKLESGVPFGFKDEICCRPRMGQDAQAHQHFVEWLSSQGIAASELGLKRLKDIVPLETPEALQEAMLINERAARRVFYYTSIFRQKAGTDRLRWNTEAYHRLAGSGAWTSTLVADHPYFGGTGLGMGMVPNMTWGGAPLALDWFDLARRRAVDLIGIEDWMGLQYMYGPNTTWEGFQLMGFQAAIMHSGGLHGGGPIPIISWITPSNEQNFRLKAASSLCQGAKHFFFWTYGPTCTSTENYWSDLRGAYDGMAHLSRQLAFSEPVIAEGRLRPARIAILYSISSDLWQPFGYLHMLERRSAYLAFVHAQHRVDFVTEDDIEAGRLEDYDLLWTSDPCIRGDSVARIQRWLKGRGRRLIGSCGAGHFNEFGEPVDALAEVFGFESDVSRTWRVQPAQYRVRGMLNKLGPIHKDQAGLEWVGLDWEVKPISSKSRSKVPNGRPLELVTDHTTYFCGTPGVSYARAAKFVREALAEKWPLDWRKRMLSDVGYIKPPVLLSHPVVEVGLYDHNQSCALVLGNFTYSKIPALEVAVEVKFDVEKVHSAENGSLEFSQVGPLVNFALPLGISDIVRIDGS